MVFKSGQWNKMAPSDARERAPRDTGYAAAKANKHVPSAFRQGDVRRPLSGKDSGQVLRLIL